MKGTNEITWYEAIRITYRWHKLAPAGDRDWAESYLDRSVRAGLVTEAEAEAMRIECTPLFAAARETT